MKCAATPGRNRVSSWLNFWIGVFGLVSCAAAADKLTITPLDTQVLLKNSAVNFTATLDGNSNLTTVVKWSSSGAAVATIDSSGKATALRAGTTTITAALGSLSVSTRLTVIDPEPSFSPTRLMFGNQLVGTTSPQPLIETVTNVGTTPLVLKSIAVSGTDTADFTIISPAALPATLAPGASLSASLSFAPRVPWKAGTRNASLLFSDNAGSQSIGLTGTGISCAGPAFAAASQNICADTDGDGLNDAWEDNDYIDMNNNGVYDAGIDFAFPHRTPYVFSDVGQTGTGAGQVFPTVTDPTVSISDSIIVVTIASGGPVGTATLTYTVNGGSPSAPQEIRPVVDIAGNMRLMSYLPFNLGDTYTFTVSMGTNTKIADKNVPNIYVQYDYMDWDAPGNACTVDSDCDAGGSQLNSVCHAGACTHNHFPGDPLFRKVVDQFAAHGITLYILPKHLPVPHATVVTWSKPGDGTSGATAACAGAHVIAGNIGPGQLAVSFDDIKNRPGSDFALDSFRKGIFHYAVLGHANTCLYDTPGINGSCRSCPSDRSTPSGFPFAASSGTAELPGNDFIVSLGPLLNDGSQPDNPFNEGGVFMHELGHNIGLHHDGDLALPEKAPNYLSVMNYRYTFAGITHAAAPGSRVSVEALRELNYSEHELNTLMENQLDESTGVSPLSSGYTGIVRFWNGQGANVAGPEAGPTDWSGNGFIDPGLVSADLNQLNAATETMVGYRDWDHSAVGGGACTISADCRINDIRLMIHNNIDSTIDVHEPCVRGRCQSLWYAFQSTPWGMADGPAHYFTYEPAPPPEMTDDFLRLSPKQQKLLEGDGADRHTTIQGDSERHVSRDERRKAAPPRAQH